MYILCCSTLSVTGHSEELKSIENVQRVPWKMGRTKCPGKYQPSKKETMRHTGKTIKTSLRFVVHVFIGANTAMWV